MIKKSMALILTLLLLVIAGSVTGEEIAKEGSASGTTYFTYTPQVLAQGEAYLQMNYDARGVVTCDDETSILHLATAHCVGAAKAIKGAFNESGLCTFTRPDKDQIFGSYEATGKLGEDAKGTTMFLGGTGKFEAMTGRQEYTRTSLQGPAKGVGASFVKFTYTWKIP